MGGSHTMAAVASSSLSTTMNQKEDGSDTDTGQMKLRRRNTEFKIEERQARVFVPVNCVQNIFMKFEEPNFDSAAKVSQT